MDELRQIIDQKTVKPTLFHMNLSTTILDLSDESSSEKIHWTLRDAFEGVQIFGGIGSGKTSGSGNTLARAYLRKGFGGLVLCAKPDECKRWKDLASLENRGHDVIVFSEKRDGEKPYYFNPLDYESRRKVDGKGGGQTFNLVNLFMQIYQMGHVISGEGLASGGERFWDNALKRCLSRMIDFLTLAGELITVENMYRLISESLTSKELEYFVELRKKSDKDSKDTLTEWAKLNFYVRSYLKCMKKLRSSTQENSEVEIIQLRKQIETVRNYFEREFANLAEKTKTIIVESFLGLAEPFQGGILKKYFSAGTNLKPEAIFNEGKIVILDFPIKNYLDSGVYAQGIFKLLFQQAVERRTYQEGVDKPVFLWVDESQNFINAYDQIFQTTARSSGVSTVFITQNISNYYVAIGGKNATARVDSLLGNLSTKIFHNNNDYVTNEWAAKLIGKSWQNIESYNVGHHQSFGVSKQYHWSVEPDKFSILRKGGDKNDFLVDAVIVLSDEVSNERNYMLRTFNQKTR